MKTKNYFTVTLLFSLICLPFFGQQTSEKKHEHEELPCDQTVHGTFDLPILMHCEKDIFITSLPEDGNTGTIIYGGLESDTRIQILPGHTFVKIKPNTTNAMQKTHTTTRLRNGNLGRISNHKYNYTDTKDKSSSMKDKKNGKETVKIFPNPFTNVLQMTSEVHPIVAYEIQDLYGKTIRKKTVKATYKQEISVSELQKGMYLLSLYFQNGSQQQQRIIKH